MVHRESRWGPTEPREPIALDGAAVTRLVEIVRTDEGADEALVLIQAILLGGAPLESIYIDLMSPAARRLGDMWLADECSFADVTMGLCRLQRVMRTLAQLSGDSGQAVTRSQRGRVILASIPGEQHSFGVLMLEEFFRRDGWEVEAISGVGRNHLLRSVRLGNPVAVGLSASVDDRLPAIRALVADIREAADNDDLVVMVGGRCFNDNPNHASAVGADFTAIDGRQAIGHIQSLIPTASQGG